MIFNRRTITKLLDLVNLQRHNDNYADIQTDLTNHEGRITGAQNDITTHKASTAAHPAEHVTYSGSVAGAGNIQEAVDFVDERLDTIIVGGSEDKDPELTDIKTPDPSYTPGRTIAAAGDLVRDMQKQFGEQLAERAKGLSLVNLRKGFVAHRGFQPSAPEDTLKAITEAGRRDYVMCEIDPNITSDGYWVVCHDEKVDRTTDGTGTISNMTLAQVQACKVDTPPQLIDADEVIRIPLLEDVVKEVTYWGMGLNIDGGKFRWDAAKAQYLWELLKKYNIAEKSMISLPVISDRTVFKQYAPDLPICIAPSAPNVDADLLEASNYKYPVLAYQSSVLTDAIVTKCNNAEVPVYVWGANDYKTSYQWLNKGVTFVETDYILPGGGIAK